LKKQLAICAALSLLGFGAAGTAVAQAVYAGSGYAGPGYAPSGPSDPVLPPYEIMSIVRSTGLAPLTRPMRRGPYYVLVAVDRAGRQMRVVVDAQLGDIVNMRPATAAISFGPGASYGPESGRPYGSPGAVPPGPVGPTAAYSPHPNGDAPAPLPPRSIPKSTIPDAATQSGAAPNAASPGAHAANAPAAAAPRIRLAVAEPALPPPPPLPRPRPKLALNETSPEAPTALPPAGKPSAPVTAPRAATPSGADDASQQIE
jgi:hypothetical protein